MTERARSTPLFPWEKLVWKEPGDSGGVGGSI